VNSKTKKNKDSAITFCIRPKQGRFLSCYTASFSFMQSNAFGMKVVIESYTMNRVQLKKWIFVYA